MPNGATPSFTISCKNYSYQRGLLWECVWKKLCSLIHSPHLCWRSLTDLYIFIWGSTYGLDRNVETKYTFCQRPFSWNLSCILQQEGVTTQDTLAKLTKSSRYWEQKTLIFNSNYWQKISKVWHVQDTRGTSRHLPDIDQSFSNNASHRGNNSQIRAGLVCETLHYLHQIPFSLHCRHNRHCRATYVAAWPTVQHEKQYKSSQNDLYLCLFACEPNF